MTRREDVVPRWHIVDAEGMVLGRLAAEVAHVLRGKHLPTYTPSIDNGDYVIVVNADKVRVTGNKLEDKKYYHHSGYPGGLRETSLRQMQEKHPERVIETAIRGMLPKNRLGRQLFRKLKVYAGPRHPHAAQQPQELRLGGKIS
ncbi:MAG: 50S ribosomal protein L13 [Thermaerobacter sp.]|nr:50S ribosomal protein L13 [Thermaerobacter sp.]